MKTLVKLVNTMLQFELQNCFVAFSLSRVIDELMYRQSQWRCLANLGIQCNSNCLQKGKPMHALLESLRYFTSIER